MMKKKFISVIDWLVLCIDLWLRNTQYLELLVTGWWGGGGEGCVAADVFYNTLAARLRDWPWQSVYRR